MAIVDESISINAGASARRYDLDWLRVIAFGLLIFYHVGMFYVSWGWHVKSTYAGPAAEPLMLIVNPWRLALLFFISGVAIRFATDKVNSRLTFMRSRLYRLGLPILLGVIVIVAPQSYFELRQAGAIEPGYLAFWGNYLKLDQLYPMITPTWNHLWYVVYLLVYILLITPFLPLMRRFAEGVGGRWFAAMTGGPVRLLLLVIIPFVSFELLLSPHFPTTHALIDDWANHAHRFTIFLLGYFAAKNMTFWRSVGRAFPAAAVLVVVLAVTGVLIELYEDALAQTFLGRIPFIGEVITVFDTLYAWSFIVFLLAAAQRYLNSPSRALTYLTSAVFCYYILHQTIIIVAGYYLTKLQLGVWVELTLVMSITIGGCAGGYEIARRIPGLRPWLGIRAPK
ncbi:MAG: acyltransferase family protein [Marinicaulis sp.]|nr:acyltransferase family protein [Marinicaulis sp.]